VLRSDFLTTGPEVEAFEGELGVVGGAKHAVVVANGTAALHCAYAALEIGPGDEIVTTPLTFSATSNAVLALGGKPVFVDVDAATLCLDPARAENAITPRTKAIAAVDFAGNPADLVALREICTRKKIALVEDAAHSIGSRLHGKPVGSLADLTTFSFHPVKTITTAEGGAVLTNDDALARRVRDFRNHGLVRDAARLERNDGPWYYEIQSLGLNYRLTDVQCALGRSQLKKLPAFSARRKAIVAKYTTAFGGDARVRLQTVTAGADPTWHLFTLQLRDAATRAHVFSSLRATAILPQVHYIAVNDLPLYRSLGYDPTATPIAQSAAQRLISLPLYPAMTDADVDRVIGATRAALDARG
jgi:dTDP-4-amino-4,6-dideoxygalactose transaminase